MKEKEEREKRNNGQEKKQEEMYEGRRAIFIVQKMIQWDI
jgi:hypothetical protein